MFLTAALADAMLPIMESERKQIAAILSETEKALQKIIAEAAGAGRYAVVDAARMAASGVRQIRLGAGTALTGRSSDRSSRPRGHKRKRSGRSPKVGYPKFLVRNGVLVRLGWSKRKGTEYVHKVPRAAFDSIVEVCAGLARSGPGPFPAEEVVRLANAQGHDPIPAYQVYVVIGLLRQEGSIEQVGREGYKFPPELAEHAQVAWKTSAEAPE